MYRPLRLLRQLVPRIHFSFTLLRYSFFTCRIQQKPRTGQANLLRCIGPVSIKGDKNGTVANFTTMITVRDAQCHCISVCRSLCLSVCLSVSFCLSLSLTHTHTRTRARTHARTHAHTHTHTHTHTDTQTLCVLETIACLLPPGVAVIIFIRFLLPFRLL